LLQHDEINIIKDLLPVFVIFFTNSLDFGGLWQIIFLLVFRAST